MSNLTSSQKEAFRKALDWVNAFRETVEDVDVNGVLDDNSQVADCGDTISDFSKNAPRSAVVSDTPFGKLYVWEKVQSAPGRRRGTLHVMDFGERRAAYFDGE